jgi:hypothetical protein
MSRTYRRRGERHQYHVVLRDWLFESGYPKFVVIDRYSKEGRRLVARFHSDGGVTMKSGVPAKRRGMPFRITPAEAITFFRNL